MNDDRKMIKQQPINLYAKMLGYNYYYHYNSYTNKWYCYHREHNIYESLDDKKFLIEKGSTIEEAQRKMLKRIGKKASMV